ILIVDDNKSNLETLNFMIEDIDFEKDIKVNVIQCNNGNDALNLAIKYKIALIILDIQMPDMDGFEVARYLKKSSKTKDIPIAFLTAVYKSDDMREYGLHIGAFDYFTKPIDPLILVPKIKLYVNFYAITHELKDANLVLEEKIKVAVDKNSKMEAKLYKSEKLASMAEMIGNIAHQWRQPLSVISTAATGAKLQQEYGNLDEKELNKLMDSINSSAQFLSKTIDNFRNFLNGDNGENILFNLTNDIEKCCRIEETILNESYIKVVKDFDDSIELINLPNDLLQALVNIIDNSKDALLSVEDKEERFIFLKTEKIDDKVVITITDTAGGISNDIIKKIFDPYFTTKHKSQGTGLGLHMTYTIITNNMNGSLDVENDTFSYNDKQYTGARFTIKLPLKNQIK
ncbi:MAG: hybrid sensor histidine kinase/response regulator, partial [Campylobacterota bacterium]|nr:hybrid sensor histidine kinase/response regulator [Campylobacterota bacterium]